MLKVGVRTAVMSLAAAMCTAAVAQTEVAASDVAGLAPQRAGVVDAYAVVVALDDDPVFGKEAREAARVIASRFDASGRTILLAAGERIDGSPERLEATLAAVARIMDRKEDVLVLYSTSHGRPGDGLTYRVGQVTRGSITAAELASALNRLGFQNRLIILQACYSGQFIPALAADRTIVITAAAHDRSSFGCTPGNDWTFFGHAFVNQALRKPTSLLRQFMEAEKMIAAWEKTVGVEPSRPQISMGRASRSWLAALEARAPKAVTEPVGQPPAELSQQ